VCFELILSSIAFETYMRTAPLRGFMSGGMGSFEIEMSFLVHVLETSGSLEVVYLRGIYVDFIVHA
jgi:hypothetical protein